MIDAHVIQNPDINIGPAAYKERISDELLVTSVFYTIQGEGPFAGHPAVFVRLAGCNRGRKTDMGCRFCDTAFQFALGSVYDFAGLCVIMENKLGSRDPRVEGLPMVVLTGGEPMMQNNVAMFCHYLKHQGWPHVQIESNGDRLVENLPDRDFLTLVVSPKVSRGVPSHIDGLGGVVADVIDMGRYEYKSLKSDVFHRADCFKFLIETQQDSPYGRPAAWADGCGKPVYVSPMTHYARPVVAGEIVSMWNHRLVDVPRTRANYAYAADIALRFGYRISMQTHLFYAVP